MKTPLSAFVIVGLLAIVGMLGMHSRMLMQDRDTRISERDTALAERDKARAETEQTQKHEQELQAALLNGEKKARALQQDYEREVEALRNAKPNDCTDAPVAPDIDRILREQAANLGYYNVPDSAGGIAATPDSKMGRHNQSRPRAALSRARTHCISL